MDVKQSKDFLVQQTAEQAALEGVPLSDLEKRMMYFTEGPGAIEDPTQLNDEFEAQYDSEEYESKISGLLQHARARAKEEKGETARFWTEAVRTLSEGDHYILVLCNEKPTSARPPYDSLKLLGACLLVVAGIFAALAVADHYGVYWQSGRGTRSPVPVWLQRLGIGIIIGAYVYAVVLPWISKRPPPGMAWLFARFFGAEHKSKQER